MDYDAYVRGLENIRHQTDEGTDFWTARELMPLLDYTKWSNFCAVIEKAKAACDAAAMRSHNHFAESGNMVLIGSGAQRERGDWYLSRYACYLIAMNSDSSKTEVGYAMTYFAAQTRRQELQDKFLSDEEKRLQLRLRLMDDTKRLAGAAKKAGVVRHPIFQDAGYRGMYTMGLTELKIHKKLGPAEDLFDNVSRLELSALDFKATLTEDRLNRDQVKTEQRAIETHRVVGQEVRAVMIRDNGVKPENLPKEPSIKRLVQRHRRAIKKSGTV